jgi:7,8-dihydropterin-6-yl-methyl-4-(beta-D-ribofuranosyl)aminobenzene 5'-phosphate synthase
MPKITILSENHTYNSGLNAEHGFSCVVELKKKRYLFDTGKSSLFIQNAHTLNVNIVSLDGIIISHGHYDHAGGLMPYLENFKAKIYAAPGIFSERYSKKTRLHPIGVPFTQEKYESIGAVFKFVEKPLRLDENVYLTGPIPRHTDFEKVEDPFIIKTENGLEADAVMDEQALVILANEGLVIVTGCGHAGIINIINYAKKISGEKKIEAIIGGFHLRNISQERFDKTAAALEENIINSIIPLHCTGMEASAKLYGTFPQKVKFLSGGETFYFE